MGIYNYHSVDGGDILTGRPYGYTEEYQSYEQTGTESYISGYTSERYLVLSGTHANKPGYGCENNHQHCTITQPVYGYHDVPIYSSRPTYGYVTRTRLTTYDKQSGLFSLGIGVPYPALNQALYSTRTINSSSRSCV